jgi:hypothetical protein
VQRALRQRSPVLLAAEVPAAASRTKEVRP